MKADISPSAMTTTAKFFVHQQSDVQTTTIGAGTTIWQYCVVLARAKIGANVNICSHCFIENEVRLGDNVTIKNGNYIYDGITIEDDVFVGPNVTFTNDKYPRSKTYLPTYPRTLIKKGASIGGGAVIVPRIVIDEGAMIGAGAFVTTEIPAQAVVYGKAARIRD